MSVAGLLWQSQQLLGVSLNGSTGGNYYENGESLPLYVMPPGKENDVLLFLRRRGRIRRQFAGNSPAPFSSWSDLLTHIQARRPLLRRNQQMKSRQNKGRHCRINATVTEEERAALDRLLDRGPYRSLSTMIGGLAMVLDKDPGLFMAIVDEAGK